MNQYAQKTILITGGSSGIGLTTAEEFLKEGARVIITGRDEKALKKAKESLTHLEGQDSSRSGKDGEAQLITFRSDAAKLSDAAVLAQFLESEKITLDAVFINAGIAKFSSLLEAEESVWDETFNINIKGAYFTIKALVPFINKGSAIILNGSINAHIGMAGSSIYAASKAALVSLAKTLSADLLGHQIRVNVVSPGPVVTPIHDKLVPDAEQLKAVRASIESQIPIGRFGQAQEIASAVLYLASKNAAFIVGTELIIDGGMSQL